MSEPQKQKKAVPASPELKDYTLELPMFDLGEVIKLVTDIHEKALETATMGAVAKGCGYSSASSTPFYRRILAARLFKLLSQQGAGLTPQALDYLKPDTEDAKNQALRNSVLGIPAYEELIQTHQGKRLNSEIIANGFARKISISQSGAGICAKAFISSLKFAGFVDEDGSLKRVSAIPFRKAEEAKQGDDKLDDKHEEPKTNERSYTLVLDEKRSIVVKAPLSVKQSELKRLQEWLALQLLVVPDQPAGPSEPK